MRIVLMLVGLLTMGGCSTTPRGYLGSGTDKISVSSCAKCNKIPFYVDGKFKEAKNADS